METDSLATSASAWFCGENLTSTHLRGIIENDPQWRNSGDVRGHRAPCQHFEVANEGEE